MARMFIYKNNNVLIVNNKYNVVRDTGERSEGRGTQNNLYNSQCVLVYEQKVTRSVDVDDDQRA